MGRLGSGCCALAVSGHASAALPSNVMTSHHLMPPRAKWQ